MPLASYVHICHPGMPDPQTAQDPGSRTLTSYHHPLDAGTGGCSLCTLYTTLYTCSMSVPEMLWCIMDQYEDT